MTEVLRRGCAAKNGISEPTGMAVLSNSPGFHAVKLGARGRKCSRRVFELVYNSLVNSGGALAFVERKQAARFDRKDGCSVCSTARSCVMRLRGARRLAGQSECAREALSLRNPMEKAMRLIQWAVPAGFCRVVHPRRSLEAPERGTFLLQSPMQRTGGHVEGCAKPGPPDTWCRMRAPD